jgi:hypothetical protein
MLDSCSSPSSLESCVSRRMVSETCRDSPTRRPDHVPTFRQVLGCSVPEARAYCERKQCKGSLAWVLSPFCKSGVKTPLLKESWRALKSEGGGAEAGLWEHDSQALFSRKKSQMLGWPSPYSCKPFSSESNLLMQCTKPGGARIYSHKCAPKCLIPISAKCCRNGRWRRTVESWQEKAADSEMRECALPCSRDSKDYRLAGLCGGQVSLLTLFEQSSDVSLPSVLVYHAGV